MKLVDEGAHLACELIWLWHDEIIRQTVGSTPSVQVRRDGSASRVATFTSIVITGKMVKWIEEEDEDVLQ